MFIHAKNVKFLLADDFHDRAADINNISYEEELQNLLRFKEFTINNKLACVYTVIEKDNHIFFTSPTACTNDSLKKQMADTSFQRGSQRNYKLITNR